MPCVRPRRLIVAKKKIFPRFSGRRVCRPLVLPELRAFRREVVAGIEVRVPEELEDIAPEHIAARLGHDVTMPPL